MVTANLNHEQRPSSGADNEDDENNDRQNQTHLDRLYLEHSQYPHSHHHHHHHQHPQRTLSSSNLRDINMALNTVPVYRHGRKFYVSIEEFERMRIEERRHRRTLMQKSQNLPITKSHQTNLLPPSTPLYNPIHRSTSHSHDHRYGILRTPYLSTNSIINNHNNNNNHLHESTRQSRSTFRHYDERDDLSSITLRLPMKLSTTTIRSNSSDKILDRRRTPQSPISSYSDSIPDDYDLKRSFSAELVQPSQTQLQQPQVLPRRIVPPKTSDFAMSTVPSFPMTPTDQTYNQSNASKLTSYFTRIQPSTLNPSIKLPTTDFTGTNSMYENDIQDSNQIYSVPASSNRRTESHGLASVLTRSPSNNSNNEYYSRNVTGESFSDDNSSSPSTLIQRRNTNNNRYHRAQLVVETDDDYRQQGDAWTRSTARSQSSDRLTEKKRVRFADMEGLTLETVSDVEQKQLPMNNRLVNKRSYISPTNNLRGQEQSFHNSFYQTNTRANNCGSKLATDV
ncbi:unnamed protein product [Rotaria sordida]|uniref:Uncharacterized protein n=1 Tax=Rotaria sordida TaxID=392033 RepID=A0A814JIK5_9BILA|nr:unnamed protein product [Rotaria sordida]